MNETQAIRTISAEETQPFSGQRLDVVLAAILERSRTHAQSLLKQELVTLQPSSAKAIASYKLRAGDSIAIGAEPFVAGPGDAVGEDIPLEVVYEDKALLAINKPAGLVVHPAVGHWTGTLVNALVHRYGAGLAGRGGGDRLGIVHRLDMDTSGLLLIARTDAVHEKLSAAFAERTVHKVYRALSLGIFRRASGECRGSIGRHAVHRKKMMVKKDDAHGRTAWTDYRVQKQGKFGAEVECVLHTGRTHQIRVHLSTLGHPVWGDLLYGKRAPIGEYYPARQMLHAARIEIAHPVTGKPLKLEAPLPADYVEARAILVEGQTPS